MGGSSGGSAGKVEWPSYMQAVHSQWLNRGGADNISQSVTTTMNSAFGKSPFEGLIQWVVDDTFGVAQQTLWQMFEANRSVDPTVLYSTIVDKLSLGGVKDRLLSATAALLQEELDINTLPKYKAGMRDINAIQTSSFVIGEAYLQSSTNKQLAKLSADIDFKILDIAHTIMATTIDWNKTLVVHSTEIGRLYLAAHLDELKFNTENRAKDRLWDLRVWEYGAHVMSSISGGTAPTGGEEHSTVQNVLGGAMSGAAMGAQIGQASGYGGYGAAVGAVVGGVAGYFS